MCLEERGLGGQGLHLEDALRAAAQPRVAKSGMRWSPHCLRNENEFHAAVEGHDPLGFYCCCFYCSFLDYLRKCLVIYSSIWSRTPYVPEAGFELVAISSLSLWSIVIAGMNYHAWLRM